MLEHPIQPLAYAVVCWLLPHIKGAAFSLALAPLLFIAMVLGIASPSRGAVQAIGVAAVLMVSGLILIPFVYRHWLTMEMG